MKMSKAGFDKFLGKAQETFEVIWKDVVSIAGVDYDCAVSDRPEGGTMGLGADMPEALITVRIRKEVFAGPPVDGETLLTYDGREWRVDEVRGHKLGSVWRMNCIPASE